MLYSEILHNFLGEVIFIISSRGVSNVHHSKCFMERQILLTGATTEIRCEQSECLPLEKFEQFYAHYQKLPTPK